MPDPYIVAAIAVLAGWAVLLPLVVLLAGRTRQDGDHRA